MTGDERPKAQGAVPGDKVQGQRGAAAIGRLEQPENSKIKKVVAVMSGKGGVGKSSVAALLAAEGRRLGLSVAVLDADITGPSIPKLFGLKGTPEAVGSQLLPDTTKTGIKVMSINLLLEKEDDPVIWRGPLIAGAVKQFWTDVLWGDVDLMVVDLPPGTGDAPLTVFQSLPVDSVVIVTSPQELSVLVVRKAVNMAKMLNVQMAGLIENMSWVKCPKCGEIIEPFGPGKAKEAAKTMGLDLLGTLPLDPTISALGDDGQIEEYQSKEVADITRAVVRKVGLL